MSEWPQFSTCKRCHDTGVIPSVVTSVIQFCVCAKGASMYWRAIRAAEQNCAKKPEPKDETITTTGI